MSCENKLTNLVFKIERIVQEHNVLPFPSFPLFVYIYIYIYKIKKHLECNAMQHLETKEKKKKNKNQRTKNKGHKGKIMKHKDHKSQDRSGTHNHTNYLTKNFKLTSIKRFGEDLGILTLSRDILKTHNLSFNKIPNEVIPNLYMLSLRMLNRVLIYISIALELSQ